MAYFVIPRAKSRAQALHRHKERSFKPSSARCPETGNCAPPLYDECAAALGSHDALVISSIHTALTAGYKPRQPKPYEWMKFAQALRLRLAMTKEMEPPTSSTPAATTTIIACEPVSGRPGMACLVFFTVAS